MTISVYRPMHLAEAMNRLMEESLMRPPVFEREPNILTVDALANGDEFIVTADVPGLKPEDISVEILGSSVTIRGEQLPPAPEEKATWLLQERCYGKFARTLSFPVEIDSSKSKANVENGRLILRLPKAESARPRAVKINTN